MLISTKWAPPQRQCPRCKSILNRLTGADAHQVTATCLVSEVGTFIEVERKVALTSVYACPKCEFVQAGSADLKEVK